MTTKKLMLGVAVMITVQIAGTLIFELSNLDDFGRPTRSAWLLSFVSALAGALVARRPFYAAALSYWALVWALIIGILYSIAAPAGPVSWAALAQSNAGLILASGSALIAGAAAAHLGQARLAASRRAAT